MLLASREIPVVVHGDGRFVDRRSEFVPVYLRTYEEGRLREKVEEALEALRDCTLCPRDCHVNRIENRFAVCKTGRYARVSSFFPHFGEEDVLRGWRGSGTIFFAWCNLRCQFCFAPGTRIVTDRGVVRIEDIFAAAGGVEVTVGGGTVRFIEDVRAVTRRGEYAPVIKAFSHPYRGEMVVIKPYGLPAITATPDHEVFAASKPGAPPQRIRAGELSRRHFLFAPKPATTAGPVEIDVSMLLAPYVSRFRVPARRKLPGAALRELLGVAGSTQQTSQEIAHRTGYHPAYVRTLRGRVNRGEALVDEELRPNDLVEEDGRVRFKTEKGPGAPMRIVLDEDLATLLGYYCAEGHAVTDGRRPNSHRLIWSFGHHERSRVRRVQILIQRVLGVVPKVCERRTTVTVEVGSSAVALIFVSLCGRGSQTKRAPPALLASPPAVVRAFLAAYFDGDGCYQPLYISASTVSEDLALGIVALLLRLGVFPYFYATPRPALQRIEERTVRQSRTLYYVKCRRDAWEGCSGGVRLPYRETDEGFWLRIHSISRVPYDGPVYNLEIEDADHSYVANGVAVGNCQNYETSQIGEGQDVTPRQLAAMMVHLQEVGCHNINFVTPEHVVPQILEALPYAIEGGLRLPIVYNTSAYDSLHSMALMDGVVDVYMPDFKLWHREHARKYLLAPDYPDVGREVIRAMHMQVGPLRVDEDGLALRGVIVRHLVMPGLLDDTREILNWIAALSADTYVNVMDQYNPAWKAKTEPKLAAINRRPHPHELDQAVRYAREAGLWRLDARWRRLERLAWI